MAFFYIREDGTATGNGGRYVSALTSSWASAFAATTAYYSSIQHCYAATSAPIKGDHLMLAHTASTTEVFVSNRDVVSPAWHSVDEDAVNESRIGARVINPSNLFGFRIEGEAFIGGIYFSNTGNGDVFSIYGNNAFARWKDCTLHLDHNDTTEYLIPNMGSNTYGGYSIFEGCTFVSNSANNRFFGLNNRNYARFIACKFDQGGLDGGGTATLLNGGNGHTGIFEHCDMKNCNIAGTSLLGDNLIYSLVDCLLPTGYTAPTTAFGQNIFSMVGCDDGAGGVSHRFEFVRVGGTARNNDSTYVASSPSWNDGSTQSSIEVFTTASATRHLPFVFDMPIMYVNLSSTSEDVLTLNFVSSATLTDADISAYVIYEDQTVFKQGNVVHSVSALGSAVFGNCTGTGSALASSTLTAADWTGEPAAGKFYRIDLDTSIDRGRAAFTKVRVEVGKTSLGSGKLFIHPVIDIG